MTKLTWTGDYIDGVYLFHTGIKGDKKYEKGMRELADKMPSILKKNKKLYEKIIEDGKIRNNKSIDVEEIEEFLLNSAYGNPSIKRQAEGGYSIKPTGVLNVDGKPFPSPKDWDERDGFWCGEDKGEIDFKWNISHDELSRYRDIINENEATIYQFERWGDGKWELEIDGDFDYMKLDFESKKCRVLYDGNEFNKVEEGINQRGKNKKFWWCYFKGEEIPTQDYIWE